eukprot:NODE_18504_length_889_cov_3.645669.p1 GENE.NODE_18504_length_889_cov_3.645669~~NODE_18504_length_889_cov_3.645669.p1  ORF type:complete len:227 (+),score=24.47 NODE_18504_length_889_cov_3.645669:60-740(+)
MCIRERYNKHSTLGTVGVCWGRGRTCPIATTVKTRRRCSGVNGRSDCSGCSRYSGCDVPAHIQTTVMAQDQRLQQSRQPRPQWQQLDHGAPSSSVATRCAGWFVPVVRARRATVEDWDVLGPAKERVALWIMFMLISVTSMSASTPNVDLFGHLGGAVGGFLFATVISDIPEAERPEWHARARTAASLALSMLFVGGLTKVLHGAADPIPPCALLTELYTTGVLAP